MAVKIRLRRMGSKKRAFYRIVVADSKTKRNGRVIAEIGYYNPIATKDALNIDTESANKWLDNGAIPTDTARNLLKEAGVLKARHEAKVAKEPKKEKAVKAAKTVKTTKTVKVKTTKKAVKTATKKSE